MLFLINEKGFTQHEAWNESSILLINASKVYINIYVANCFLTYILAHEVPANQAALIQLFELFILYDFCENFSSDILKVLGFLNSFMFKFINSKLFNSTI